MPRQNSRGTFKGQVLYMAEPYAVPQPAKTHAFTAMAKTYIIKILAKIVPKLQFIRMRFNFFT